MIEEDTRERLQIAAYPVWLTRGKKGVSFRQFCVSLNLMDDPRAARKPARKAMTRSDRQELYRKAEEIRRLQFGDR